jgi:general secretion pathway protein I
VKAQRGYTLIEVMVAFAILALALTLLLGTLSGATQQIRWADDAGRAALHAESLLSQTGVGEALAPGRTEGNFEDGRYRWTMEIQPWVDPSLVDVPPQPVDPGAPRLLSLDLEVQWGSGAARERLHLQSLRLVTPDPLGSVQ